ncbi:integrin alpha-X-like [Chanos chanos]|uniref:Integrin alpha-X-like n=1 Tax=Chanos chanos TaxID=29144 RepID=A0A6J2WX62_CHACN|nr:integrin alpha-X-like [Chanos chanos]
MTHCMCVKSGEQEAQEMEETSDGAGNSPEMYHINQETTEEMEAREVGSPALTGPEESPHQCVDAQYKTLEAMEMMKRRKVLMTQSRFPGTPALSVMVFVYPPDGQVSRDPSSEFPGTPALSVMVFVYPPDGQVCGPHLLQRCEGFDYLNGQCAEIGPEFTESHTLRPAFQDFQTMISFIKDIIRMFTDPRALVAVAKFSNQASAEFHFVNFEAERDPDKLLKQVTQSQGDTHTPSAIRFVLFAALSSIQEELKNKIFSVEGEECEKSVFGAVGAYSWSGGLTEKLPGLNETFINATATETDMKDSYLGYSVATVTINGAEIYFAGAPRYKHTGLVLAFQQNPQNRSWVVTHRIHGSQLGSYFGAELCVFAVENTVLLLVGVPLFHTQGVGGEVRICSLQSGSADCSAYLRGVMGNDFGRFGASLSLLPDLSGDSLPELAVGAPHEEKGHGALYIFLGQSGGVRPKFSQRVTASALDSGLQYFGVSVHSAGDLNSDGLSDLAVGARGAMVILRSQPVMCLPVSVTFDPDVIPQNYFHCSAPLRLSTPVAALTMCVTLKEVVMGKIQGPLQVSLSVFLKLDSQRRDPRLLFSSRLATSLWNTTLNSTEPVCQTLSLIIPECISDYHEVNVSGELALSAQRIPKTQGLTPTLSPDCPPSFTHMVLLEKVCGEDHVCISDLSLSLSFASDMVICADGFPVTLLVNLTNHGEDSSGTELTLTHPTALSFNLAKPSVGQVWCTANSSERSDLTHTVCQVGSTLFRQAAQTTLQVSYTVTNPSNLTEQLIISASVMSNNEKETTLQDNSASSSLPVKQPVNILLQEGDSTQYIKYPDNRPLEHIYRVLNIGDRHIPVNVLFLLPFEMAFGFQWSVSLPKINGSGVTCEKHKNVLKNDNSTALSQHCVGSTCILINCSINPLSSQPISFTFSGTVSKTTKVNLPLLHLHSLPVFSVVSGLPVFSVVSGLPVSAQLYDQTVLFIDVLLSSGSVAVIASDVESPSEPQTALIVSLSVFSGLLIMAIIFVLLYKKGFFKTAPRPMPPASPPNSDGNTGQSEDVSDGGAGSSEPSGQSAESETNTVVMETDLL